MVDYCRYFQSRALAQAERHRLSVGDVFFLLEIRSCETGEAVLSKALCLGQAMTDARGPGYCWLLPGMPTHFEDTWSLDGSGFYRRTDGLMHHLDFALYNRNGASFEWPGDDEHGGSGLDDDDNDDNDDESEGEDGEFDDFIDDDGGAEGEEEGGEEGEEEGEEEGGEGERDGEEEGDEEEGAEEGGEEAAVMPTKRRRVVLSDNESDEEGGAGGADEEETSLPPPSVPPSPPDDISGGGEEAEAEEEVEEAEEEEEEAEEVEAEAEAEEEENLAMEEENELPESARGLDNDVVDLNFVVGWAECDGVDDRQDYDWSMRRRCYIAFECSDTNDHVPKLILQFQSNATDGDREVRVGWEPERDWVGQYGQSAGVWAILDSLRWG